MFIWHSDFLIGKIFTKQKQLPREHLSCRCRVESAFLSCARSRPSGQGRPGHIPYSTWPFCFTRPARAPAATPTSRITSYKIALICLPIVCYVCGSVCRERYNVTTVTFTYFLFSALFFLVRVCIFSALLIIYKLFTHNTRTQQLHLRAFFFFSSQCLFL